jgi:hypothetical protein
MKKFEHKLTYSGYCNPDDLHNLGLYGWELITVTIKLNIYYFYWKREIIDKTKKDEA